MNFYEKFFDLDKTQFFMSLQAKEDWCEWWNKMESNLNVFIKIIIKKLHFNQIENFFEKVNSV